MSRFRQFMKKYGYVGLGTYAVLGTLDTAGAMAIISVTGAEKVQEAEHYVISKAKSLIGMKHEPLDKSQLEKKPSLTTLFLAAYGVHKLLFPVRISITAAVTPSIARRLQNWGWIQKRLNK